MVTNWVITECTPKVETVFEDGILKKEYSLEEIRQRIDNGL